MRIAQTRILLPVMLPIVLCACTSPQPLFYWGHYEDLVYDMYIRPGTADAGMQIATLNQDIDRADAEGIPIAPGVHAHLGYLHYQQGNLAAARREFEIEKRLYPESTVFIDGLLGRMEQ